MGICKYSATYEGCSERHAYLYGFLCLGLWAIILCGLHLSFHPSSHTRSGRLPVPQRAASKTGQADKKILQRDIVIMSHESL